MHPAAAVEQQQWTHARGTGTQRILGMAEPDDGAPSAPKLYTDIQKSVLIPDEELDETMCSVCARMVGNAPDKSSKLRFFPIVFLFS